MATFALYNMAAWLQRRETHSIVNAALYAALTKVEYDHAHHHFAA